MFVHEVIAREVAATGTDTVFGLLGDANLFMVNSFVKGRGGTYVSAVHEASAVMMAYGYASRGGCLGVARHFNTLATGTVTIRTTESSAEPFPKL